MDFGRASGGMPCLYFGQFLANSCYVAKPDNYRLRLVARLLGGAKNASQQLKRTPAAQKSG